MSTYLFTSSRLGFRNWTVDDLAPMAVINTDKTVMEFFPMTPSTSDTQNFIERMQQQFEETNFCYFAVDILENKEFIGFIGLSRQTFDAPFNPSVDIGWRLKRSSWFNGYATEGAKACLDYAFNTLQIKELLSMAPAINNKSIAIMKKIGMSKLSDFIHPSLLDFPRLQNCVVYKITADSLK